ncbi:VWA domain-containing protein [Pseudogemmobacter sp. W21_MBD1_M6]|uniref:VWA domain-containing protein n=1 Tax=Pseudogemmobacter sp. W21_MBD1_M6 TaxID=3240271 RepID=UPI003F9682A6
MEDIPSISSGAADIVGDLSDGAQDLWLFTVLENETPTLYSARIEGLGDTGGAVTFIRLERNDKREVTRREDITTRGLFPSSRPGGSVAQIGPLMLTPGEYVLGVAPLIAGNGAYRLRFSPEATTPLSVGAGDLPIGRWSAKGPDIERCLALPQTRIDLAVFTPPKSDITVWLLDKNSKQHLRSGVAPVWRVNNLDGTGQQLCMTSRAAMPWSALLRLADTQRLAPETEPNDVSDSAVPVQAGSMVSGILDARGTDSDKDAFVLEGSASARIVQITSPEQGGLRYNLTTTGGQSVKSGAGNGTITISPYVPEPDMILIVSGDPGTSYQLSYLPFPTPESGEDAEPNETIATATLWPIGQPARGVLQDDDTDFFAIDLAADPSTRAQLWRLQADGDNVTRLEVFDAAGERVIQRRFDAGGLLRISNLYLIPGRYSVGVQGKGDYVLRLVPQGPRRDDVEFEPNEDGEELAVGQTLRGQLDTGDRDRFRFTVRAPEWLTLQIAPPLGETISVYLYSGGGEVFRHVLTGGQSVLDYTRAFWAGDYEIEIINAKGLSGLDDYAIALLPAQQPFGPVQDREPNDYAHSAERWPDNERLMGQVGVVQQDKDAYLLDGVSAGADLRFCAVPGAVSIIVNGPDGKTLRRTIEKTASGPCETYADLSNGDHVVFVEQSSTGARTGLPTDYDLVPTGSAVGARGLALALVPIGVALVSTPEVPKSFLAGFAQHVPLRLSVKGMDRAGSINLTLAASEPGWSLGAVNILSQEGTQTVLETLLTMPPDLSEREIRLHLRLRSGLTQGEVSFSVTPAAHASPLSPERTFAVPDAMLGGLDMAAQHFGGSITALDGTGIDGRDPSGVIRADALIDALATASNEFSFKDAGSGARFNLVLGGDAPVPLAGLLLTPRAAPGASKTLRGFRVEASEDGKTFKQVLRATLGAEPIEQAFAFDHIISARALRLIPETNWTLDHNTATPVRLGEFKAVAAPGWTPAGSDGFNIADPNLGGHVVWAMPSGQLSLEWDRDLLLGNDTKPSLVRDTDRMSVVLGFHNARAARIAAIDWTMATETLLSKNAMPVTDVVISSSLTGPLGPWTEVARWAPPASALPDKPARFDLPAPIWARYLRLDLVARGKAEYLRLPEQLRVWETSGTAVLPSILGEWGEFSEASAFENSTTRQPDVIARASGGAARNQAVPLLPDHWVSSSVERGAHEDWWSITSPHTTAELRVSLDTGQAGGAQPALFDANGTPVGLRRATKAEAVDRGLEMPLYLARLDTSGPFALRIAEPLRPIMVVWDTSGSTAPYKAAMQRAIQDIAQRADPQRDLIGFLPFGSGILGEQLLGDPELLIRRLGNHAGGGNSSNAENALRVAALSLLDQDGVRGVILITDGATGRDLALWDTLARVRPRVGALALPSTGAFGKNPTRERDLMESWGRANGGFYQYVSTQADFTEGFMRAVDRMRGPKPYRARIGFGPAVAQPDGSLRVRAGQTPPGPVPQGSESLIVLFDTSGSMLKRLGSTPRYRIAKEALAALATTADAQGIAIGLRRFGIQPDACDTELLAPVRPAGGAELRRVIDGIIPQNNARTPIALALAAARKDLDQRNGTGRIIILTDGEETCDGDPRAEIKALSDLGISSRIDIVGFAIDDDALSGTFDEWARLGQGSYINAQDADQLVKALLGVAQPRFYVSLADGTMFEGVVGGPSLPLAPGQYSLVIEGRPEALTLEITPGDESVIEVSP